MTIYDDEVLADNPTIYWKCDESVGTVVTDSSGNANDGTYVGGVVLGVPGLVAGQTAVSLDGINDHLVSDATFAGPFAELSIECMIQPDDNGTSAPLMALLGLSFGGAEILFDGGTLPTGAQAYIQNVDGSASLDARSDPDTIDVGVARHLLATYDGADLIVYVDGVAQIAEPGVLIPELDTAAELYVGTDFGLAQFLEGTISNIAFYESALSPERAAAHFAALTPVDPITEGPTVRLVTTRALAVPHQVQRWVLPIICKEMVQTGDQDNVEMPQDVAAVREFFLGLRRSGTPVAFQEGTNRHLVVVRDVSFPDGFAEQWGSQRAGLEGILVVTLDSTES